MPNYQKLKTMVKRSSDQKLRLPNFHARNERIETGAIAGVNVVLKEDKENAVNGKAKGQCSSGDKSSFRNPEDKGSKTDTKNRSTLRTSNTKRLKCVEEKEPQGQESTWEVRSTTVQR